MNELSRRRFLRWTVWAGLAGAVGWRFLAVPRGESFEGLQRLSQTDARILAAVYSTITLQRNSNDVREAVHFMDEFLGNTSARDLFELKAGLRLLEHTSLVRFTSMSAEGQTRTLESWRTGAFWRRPLFSALKELSYLYYYTRPKHWREIGYTGPLV